MSRRHPRRPLVRLASWALVTAIPACVLPTDESNTLYVTIDALSTTVIRGESLLLRARAAVQDSAGAALRPGEVTFAWSSDDETIATVTGNPDGSAIVHGLNSGRVTIRATARDYRYAHPGEQSIRVSNTVAIDAVIPDTVRYGEQVTISGVGLGRVDQVLLGETALITVPSSFAGDSLGEGSQRYWIPYPARTGRVLAIASEGFSAPAATETVVVPENALQSGDGSATLIDLDGPPLAPDGTLFFNPALALTPDAAVNVFRLVRSDTTRPLTIVVSTSDPVVTDLQPTVSLPGDFSPNPLDFFGWRIGTSQQLCQRTLLVPAPDISFGSRPATVVRSLQQTFTGGIDLRVTGGSPGRYAVRVVDGYLSADPRIRPDRFEENDYCDGADLNAQDPAKQLDPMVGISELLTIDEPFDLDWFRLTVPEVANGSELVTIRTASLPFAAGDSSSLGVALVARDSLLFAAPSPLSLQFHQGGRGERLTMELTGGDYYLLVADEAGVVTRYGLCAAPGNDCLLPEAP